MLALVTKAEAGDLKKDGRLLVRFTFVGVDAGDKSWTSELEGTGDQMGPIVAGALLKGVDIDLLVGLPVIVANDSHAFLRWFLL